MRHAIFILIIMILQACASKPVTNIVDENFISSHSEMFDGYLRGATFNHSDGKTNLINLYIRRVGGGLVVKPALYFSTGETAILDADTYVQVALPRDQISEKNPYTIVSHGDAYLHETRIWVEDSKVENVIIDHEVDESLLFFLGFGLGLGTGEVNVSSFVAFPESADTGDSIVVVNKRLKNCKPENCINRIQTILGNNQ